MKTAISAFLILAILVSFLFFLSRKQESILTTIYHSLKSLNPNQETVINNLRENIKAFEDNTFVIKSGIPANACDNIHALMKKALIYIEGNNKLDFSITLEECILQIESLIEYCNFDLDNIL